MKHNKINLIITASMFILLLTTPVIKSLVNPGHSHPQLEKRRLKHKPEQPSSLQDLTNFPDEFETYFKDNFEFRYAWLDIYKRSKLFINDPADNKVIFGNEPGWLFFNDRAVDDVVGDYRNINQFSKNTLKQLNKCFLTFASDSSFST